MALIEIQATKATDEQLADYLEINGIVLDDTSRADRTTLLQLHKTSKFPAVLKVRELQPVLPVANLMGAEQRFEEQYDPTDERWIRIIFSPDEHSSDKHGAIFIGENTDFIYVSRGKDYCIRERFVRNLKDAKEIRTVQDNPTGKFSQSKRVPMDRHPHRVLQILGRVCDGPPVGLPESVQLLQ